MSSMSSSNLFLKRNLLRNDEDSVPLSYHHCLQNNSLDMMGLVPPTIDWIENNIDNARMTICKFSVKGFDLEELLARITNGFIVIKGRHDEKRDRTGLTSRMFTRRVPIPCDVIEDEIKVHLCSNEFILISGKKRSEVLEIPLQIVHIPALKQKRDQPAIRQSLNCPSTTMLNPKFLSFLDIFRIPSQLCKHNRFKKQNLSIPILHRKKTILD
ncbi:unnamed protein product [Nezara viridula]|uniref:SHSP domain-containing protein n=1 Tax=Nezara viridula TaxID=85310 RepID=A0A9P0HIW8_NEZVI|nr:unnamed protein product [Nezara viridula]